MKFLEFSEYFEKISSFWCSNRGISRRLGGLGVWVVVKGGDVIIVI